MKKVLFAFAIIILGFMLVYQQMIGYLLMQAGGQLEVLWSARPVDEILRDTETDEETKEKIELIRDIQRFAQDSLGMDSDGKYQTIYDQKGKDILWNLTACAPFRFQSKEWYFPIVGSVSYKGFFDLEKAKSEKIMLDDQGFDTRIRSVNAWSTLGWFDDPILSNTLSRAPGSLSELFIHEITHGHIFFRDSLVFNENIASFIGEQGARLFLISKFGKQSQAYTEYVNSEADYALFTQHVLEAKEQLEECYDGFDDTDTDQTKFLRKYQLIQKFVDEMDTLSFRNTNRFRDAFKDELPNNAFFMAFDRYSSLKSEMKQDFDANFNGNLRLFIKYYHQD